MMETTMDSDSLKTINAGGGESDIECIVTMFYRRYRARMDALQIWE